MKQVSILDTYVSLVFHWGREEVVLCDWHKVRNGDAGEEARDIL